MGHIGLTPQSVNQVGGLNRVQGKFPKAAAAIIEDALALESAGAYAVVIEMVPAQLAAMVTERLSIPTIGIAAGVQCDGQVQVFHDLLGLIEDFAPKHARRYANLAETMKGAVGEYVSDVRSQSFPSDAESHHMKPEVLEQLAAALE
jgi:3-methyl-2-oxobutanoate hydroxymethyltransferase